MTPRHRLQPERTGGAVRRAVVTSVLSALALTSVTITAAAITLTNGEPLPAPPPAAGATAASSTSTTDDDAALDAPVEVIDAEVGIPDIALVAADGPSLASVPTPALAAYQRAEAVLAQADQRCRLDWTLVAAVGHVVTGHGGKAGSELDEDGLMKPRYAGDPLKDEEGRRIPDSDAGRVDGDKRFDRPVGPMQLSPATWAVVGVDGDGDGRRDPHDIDDAALAVAVLMCSGDGSLQQRAGRVDGVSRVNDNATFIATVLAVDRAYQAQLAAAVDIGPVVVPSVAPPTYMPTDLPTNLPRQRPSDLPTTPDTDGPTFSTGPSDPVTWSPPPPSTATPTDDPEPCPDPTTDEPTTDEPTDEPIPTDEPTDGPTGVPTDEPTPTPTETVTASPTNQPTDDPTDLPTCTDEE